MNSTAPAQQVQTHVRLHQWVTVGQFLRGVRRAIKRDLFVAGQFLRLFYG